MNNSSAETESSVSDQRSSSVNAKKNTNLIQQYKLKVNDLRRITPRQLKQQKQNSGSDIAKTTSNNSPAKFNNNPSKFDKLNSVESVGNYTNPSEVASNLLRTASWRIKSTFSKLKRSNSGHTTTTTPKQPPVVNSAALEKRRSSGPSSIIVEPTINRVNEETSSKKVDIIRKISSIDVKQTSESSAFVVMLPQKPETSKATGDSPLPPGCSQWSTRLGPPPPPPVSPSKPVVSTRVLPIFQGLYASPTYIKRDQTSPSTYDITHEWKSPPLGSTFCSLPLSEADELNVLHDDCVDVGDLGRINYRTGSFMGRYPHPRSHITSQYPSNLPFSQRHLTQSITPARLSPSRPLYLSPYQQSSGNTTRSAPSPNLSSAQNPSPNVFQPIYLNSPISDSGKMHAMVEGSPTMDKSGTSFRELDPVLDRLLSDVSSIEHYRSALRSQATPLRSSSVKPLRSTVEHNERILNGHRAQTLATGMRAVSGGSSDPGSVARLDRRSSSSTLAPSHERLDEQLRQQIHDLIHLEFSYQPPVSTAQRVETRDTPEVVITAPQQGRLSEPSVNLEENLKPDVIKRISRYHPFRWSSGPRPGTKDNRKYSSSLRPWGDKTQSNLVTAGSVDQLTRSGKQPITAEPSTNATEELSHSETQLGMEIWVDFEDLERLSLWTLNASQLALLRKMSLVQMTTLVEKYCGSRSLFNCSCVSSRRTPKYKSQVNAPDFNAPNLQGNISTTAETVKQAAKTEQEPLGRFTNYNDVSAAPMMTTNGTAVHSQRTVPSRVSCNRRTSYDGPVFGQTLESWQRRLGYPLPPAVLNMLDHVEKVGVGAHGIFRRPGRKDRIQTLREQIDKNLYWDNFEDWQPYDVADLLKQFFRELPECLLTDKLSLVLVSVYNSTPASAQMGLLRCVLFAMPDENRVVLQKLLCVLHNLVQSSHVTQMGASNLAVCFAPSLFRFANSTNPSQSGVGLSPRRLRRTKSGPDPKDLADQRTAQQSLAAMITHAPNLFDISTSILRRAHLHLNQLEPRELDQIIPGGDWPTWIQMELGRLTRDCGSSKPKGWTALSRDAWKAYQSGSGAGESLEGLEIYFRKSSDIDYSPADPQLRIWRCSLLVPENNPKTILEQCWSHRSSWDPDIRQIQIAEQISDCVDICYLTQAVTFPLPATQFCVLRGRQSALADGSCAMFTVSVSVSGVAPSTGSLNATGHIYQDHVYIRPQPENNGCRVYFISRVDMKGYTPDWYIRHWGHTLVRRLLNLRQAILRIQQR